MKQHYVLCLLLMTLLGISNIGAQDIQNNPQSNHGNKFEQLGTILPTPNEYRTASGAPGPKYWQQRVDYEIKCKIDEDKLRLDGSEKITYYNNSPDFLSYLWLQLDENEHSSINNAAYEENSSIGRFNLDYQLEDNLNWDKDNGMGDKILKIVDANNKPLHYVVNKTMMRIDLPTTLKPGETFVFYIDWYYNIPDRIKTFSRGGYEYFPKDGNYLFTMSQWYPRLCVYSDFQGWQNHQFTGRGEFALTFGTFDVTITTPADHIVMGTGECQNYFSTLSEAQKKRWELAQNATEPVEIVTLSEATAAEKGKSKDVKTWIFHAENVRDFAWTTSRKYIWDAMPTYIEGKKVMCMSGYPKEAYNLYRKYSTKAVAHTIKTYSYFSIPYPYPVAQSIEAANGMEYPMICFNYGRCNEDGTYSENTKYGMLGVIIHEVGHNFFPMIVNSDERQWSWMDEGLNTFVQYLTEELFDNKYPSKRGPAFMIVDYMKLPKNQLEPIMTNSENIIQFGPNAYSKPATGLNILRETIMGRELFDFSFREYARRWAFKHPTPADLFRTMEDASAEDLDWFWRGWFYNIDPCDIAIDTVRTAMFSYDTSKESIKQIMPKSKKIDLPSLNNYEDVSKIRNREDKSISFLTDVDTSLRDFYWHYARGHVSIDTSIEYQETTPPLTNELTAAEIEKYKNYFLTEITFKNIGGLVMPIIVKLNFEDGSNQIRKIPAQVWRKNEKKVVQLFVTDKKVRSVKLDPNRETADINENNNSWPQELIPSKFTVFKLNQQSVRGASRGINPMQQYQKENQSKSKKK
ncbi:MAG: M1 family metallopeptidase [Alphaproteobacteria bacterium]|nr:M1 family metallopeptidase [Alphaproteobacteria bacterium]